MVKIKVEGKGARTIGSMLSRALIDAGVRVDYWYDVTPGEVGNCRRHATRKNVEVSIVAMTR